MKSQQQKLFSKFSKTILIKMSILLKGHQYCLLDHGQYIRSLYRDVNDDSLILSFEIIPKLFCIVNKDLKEVNRKRKYDSEHETETITVKEIYENFIKNIPNGIKENIIREHHTITVTKEVRELSQQLFESTLFDHNGISGGNNAEKPLKCKVGPDHFLIPEHSRFLCGCVKEQCERLNGNKYDVLIADPPWWNKYIRRLKSANDKLSYSMMYNEDIAAIPVKNLLATNCLVAVWCTNAPSNIDAVKNLIFPKWGVEYVTTWYWLKVTTDLKPLCPFSTGCKKQPYERLIIGKVGDVKEIPKENVIMSVPSALHSHKPPLLDLLKPYVTKENPDILELFARYLLPNTTSVGYEPLKWQHISLYELTNKKYGT